MLEGIKSRILQFLMSVSVGFVGLLKPTIDTVLVCFVFILFDIYSAWDLEKRLKEKYKIKDENFGKFSSEKSGYAFDTVLKLIVIIIGVNLIDQTLLEISISLDSYVATAFCAWELWSILENFSSESDKEWAKFLQKFMVDKAKRHLEGYDIDELIAELQKEKENSKNKEENKDETVTE